ADVYNAVVAFDDLPGVIDQLGLRSPILVGLSMGGRNAMYFTAKRPDDVARLVIVDIGPEISARASAPSSGPPEPDTWESIEQAARHLLHANPYPGIHYYRWVVSQSLRQRADGALVRKWHPTVKTHRTQPDVDWWGIARALQPPTLAVRGSGWVVVATTGGARGAVSVAAGKAPSGREAGCGRGQALLGAGDMGGAAASRRAALRSAPERVDARAALGLALYNRGDLDG